MAPRCMHRAALVASFTAVSMRIASSGSSSMAWGTRSTPLLPGLVTGAGGVHPVLLLREELLEGVPERLLVVHNQDLDGTRHVGHWRPPYGSPSRTCHEGDFHRPREQARAVGATQQLGHGASAGWAVVHRVRVYVHADEAVDARCVQAATVGRRVREGLGAVG